MVDRRRREFSDEDIAKIADTYHAWRGEAEVIERRGAYEDTPGFCKSATLEEIAEHGHMLTPGRYVGVEAAEGDGVPFEEKFAGLKAKLVEQFSEGARLETRIQEELRVIQDRG